MFRCVPSWHQRAPRARSWQQRIRQQCYRSRKLAPRYLDAIRYATIFFVAYDGTKGRVRSRLPQEVAIEAILPVRTAIGEPVPGFDFNPPGLRPPRQGINPL